MVLRKRPEDESKGDTGTDPRGARLPYGDILLATPGLLGLGDEPRAALALRLAGGGATAYSLSTDYELGLVRLLPMPRRLALDAMSSALLASSPRLFGFAERGARYWLPHALVDATGVLAASTSNIASSTG
jgi:hypothetical protein